MVSEKQKDLIRKNVRYVQFNVPLAPLSYIEIGGKAEVFLEATQSIVHPIKTLCKIAKDESIPVTILGDASNVLISDEGIPGITIHTSGNNVNYSPLNSDISVLTAWCGTRIHFLARKAIEYGFSGLEPFFGLPGTVGGAIYNNAHYKNVEEELIGNRVNKVLFYSLENPGEFLSFYSNEDLKFGYDYSVFHEKRGLILYVSFSLLRKSSKEVEEKSKSYLKDRKKTQPLGYPSSGCIFKNPRLFGNTQDLRPDIPASKLIDQAGLKGCHIGGARVSEKHAAFIINPEKKATAEDVLRLISHIKEKVLNIHGIKLQEEIFFKGDYSYLPKELVPKGEKI